MIIADYEKTAIRMEELDVPFWHEATIRTNNK